ncbi:hypothetical protein G3I20_05080 [Streptomyces sp. SID8111]|uniref:hypothetical protein n=1 Tax=Streptomyces sp. SID8111 TaxID=2706100 RepID=UPI0013C205C3|nr:hypothetical protein [Streptomyces sp. SID8111]NEB59691.1 hypothetical protein [Streptomyces diastaticus]NEC25954.1 hypothetical protein [Streptomyces sp. SID8111]NED04273.1 hypothetical protein [Streptomyces sp. SID6648]
MSGTPQKSGSLPPLLILAAPAGITTLWVMPMHYGWDGRDTAIAAAVVFLAVLALPRVPGVLAGAAKTAAKATKRKAKNKKDGKDDSKKK